MKCDYCYSCLWKEKKLEKDPLEPLVVANSTILEKYPQPAMIEQSHRQQLISPQQQEQTKDYRCIWPENRSNLQLPYLPSVWFFMFLFYPKYFKLFLSCQMRTHENAVISYENVVYQVLLAHEHVIRDVES